MVTGAPVRRGGPPVARTLRDLSRPGRRASTLPPLDVPEADDPGRARAGRTRSALPELAERDVVRHFTALSQFNYGVDTGFYPLGSCSMKYNPKVAETVAALPGFQRLHPHQPEESVQGALELLYRLERALCEITGMHRATLQPPAGASGELTGLLIMRAFHTKQGDAAVDDHHPRLGARHEPRQRHAVRVPRWCRSPRDPAGWSTWRRWSASWTRTPPA